MISVFITLIPLSVKKTKYEKSSWSSGFYVEVSLTNLKTEDIHHTTPHKSDGVVCVQGWPWL